MVRELKTVQTDGSGQASDRHLSPNAHVARRPGYVRRINNLLDLEENWKKTVTLLQVHTLVSSYVTKCVALLCG